MLSSRDLCVHNPVREVHTLDLLRVVTLRKWYKDAHLPRIIAWQQIVSTHKVGVNVLNREVNSKQRGVAEDLRCACAGG
jgi:hypothetical protein